MSDLERRTRVQTIRQTGGHRLPGGRARPELEEDDHRDGDEPDDHQSGASSSVLAGLLLHEDALSAALDRHKGALAWITANRVWLIPYLSAVFVVCVEVGAALAGRSLPMEAHAVLGAFWVFAVGRSAQRQRREQTRESKVKEIARTLGMSPIVVRDEYALLEELIRQRQLRGGDGDG